MQLPWPDVYFAPAYARACEVQSDASWELALWGSGQGSILYPYLRRDVSPAIAGAQPLFDIVSPYGYAGTWAHVDVPLREWSAFRTALRTALRERGCVAELQRLSGLLAGNSRLLQADPSLQLIPHNDTVVVSLSQSCEQYWQAAQGRSRTAVRKARRLGYQFEIHTAQADDLQPGSAFRSLYEHTMQRVGAAAGYFFSDAYYQALLAGLGQRLQLAQVRNSAGAIVAAALFMSWNELVHYHLAGSEPQAARDGANNLMIDNVIRVGCQQAESTRIHLGGGTKANDGLFRFKLGFGGELRPFALARSVLDEERYQRLVLGQARRTRHSTQALVASNYFPAYRAVQP